MTEDFEDVFAGEFEAFKSAVWSLERLALKQKGFIKIVPNKPTSLKAYAARLYCAVSRMAFVDLPNAMPGTDEVCAFDAEQWSRMPLWDVWETLRKCNGRLALAVVVGEARTENQQTLVLNPVEVKRYVLELV